MRLRALGVLVLGFLGLLGFGLVAAPAAQGQDVQSCDGVWVVVDYGTLGGGTETECATSFGTGTDALDSAGFPVSISGGFVAKIAGKPAKPDINKAYWSYWQASRNADGSYAAWAYSQVGAGESRPTKGNAEGWRYLGLSDAPAGPAVQPPAKPAATPASSASPGPATPASPGPATPARSASGGSGSVWLIVAAVVVVGGGVGLGLWWYRRGRTR